MEKTKSCKRKMRIAIGILLLEFAYDVLRANESAGTGKRKKKKSVIPVYDMNGKTITPEKKKRESRIAVAVLVIGLTLVFIYVPQFVLKDTTEKQVSVKTDTSAIRISNNALRDNPSEDYDGDGIGCNFAAYGFLGIPYGGYVIEDKNGIGMEIFEFADEVKTN